MQTNNNPNRFQYAGARQQPILNGQKARPQQQQEFQPQPSQPMYYTPVMLGQALLPPSAQQAQPKGIFGQLKDKLWNMVSEESSADRPIGISQLTRKTFNVRKEVAHNSVFKNGPTLQDYRFNELTQPGR